MPTNNTGLTLKCASPTPSCNTLLAAFTTCPLNAQSFLAQEAKCSPSRTPLEPFN